MKIAIRDGRKIAPDGKGAVLGTIEHPTFLEVGDKIALADGTDVVVIGAGDVRLAGHDRSRFGRRLGRPA